ncbi:HAD hydrolase-like protein [Candidatus Saccharibacteria bacterium]|nr:HAD hydrolase-like protein [Candidatus Saccharibacteria bacterium]MBH2007626.1 HAD hydrolase-like protein [Candidatus Saccharibacteria bacterium]
MQKDLLNSASDKKHIIFDFDKTLFWLDLEWDYFFDDIEMHMKELDANLFDSYMRNDISWGDMQNMYVHQFGSSISNKISNNSSIVEKRLLKRIVPNDELLNFIRQLDGDITLSVWSSNSRSIIEDTLIEYGLIHRFKTIASRTDVTMLKPFVDGFNLIYDGQSDRSSYLMVGDSDADCRAAAAAGIDFHAVTMSIFR